MFMEHDYNGERGISMSSVILNKIRLSNGETIAYRGRGNGGQTIVFIHGNMTSSKHWDVLFETMPRKYKLYAPDLRGFGESTYHQPIKSIKDFSDDIKCFVNQLGVCDFILVGWSLGGAVAMQFVADYPGIAKKLVLLASASTRGYPFYASSLFGLPNLSKRLTSLEEIRQDPTKTLPVQSAYDTNDRTFLTSLWNSLIYRRKKPDSNRYAAYIDDMLTQRNLAEVYHALNHFNISATHNGLIEGTNQAKDISVPVLVLRGNEDLVISEQMTKELLEDLGQHVEFVPLTGCGHSPLIDDLAQLTEEMIRFIEK